MAKKFLLIAPKNRTIYNFRGDLIRLIQSRGYAVTVIGPNKDDIKKVEELGVKFIEVPMNKNGINPIDDLRYLFRLIKVIKSERPDVTMGYTVKPAIYGAIAARCAHVRSINSMITGVGYLFTAKSTKAHLLRLLASLLYRVGLKCAHRVIFQNSDDLDEFIIHRLVPREKCYQVNGSGVNMEYFQRCPLPDQPTFFMLSRILCSKGIREYLNAAQKVKLIHSGIRFMLLGAIEKMPDALSMSDLQPYIDAGIIDYYGETNDVRSYMKQCSVFVLPSYREGIPRTVLEAMSMGRTILTTNAPGCRETVLEGKTGFLVPVKDSESLAQKIFWLIDHPDRISEMGAASHRYCQERFEISKVNSSMCTIMDIK